MMFSTNAMSLTETIHCLKLATRINTLNQLEQSEEIKGQLQIIDDDFNNEESKEKTKEESIKKLEDHKKHFTDLNAKKIKNPLLRKKTTMVSRTNEDEFENEIQSRGNLLLKDLWKE